MVRRRNVTFWECDNFMIICIDVSVDENGTEKETLEEIRKKIKDALKDCKSAKLIKRFGNVGITFWEMYY